MIESQSSFIFNTEKLNVKFWWDGNEDTVAYYEEEQIELLHNLETPLFIIYHNNKIGLAKSGSICLEKECDSSIPCLGLVPILQPEDLGDITYRRDHGVKYTYQCGAMANGISSEDMVISLGKKGYLGSFGSGGLTPQRVEEAIKRIQEELPNGPYAFNLLHSPYAPQLEWNMVNLYLQHGVKTVEAAGYINPSPMLIYFRAQGLSRGDNEIIINHKVIAKVSRREVAEKFLHPAPNDILQSLVLQNLITREQAELSSKIPIADDITAEADSGGHTDKRALVSLLPYIITMRDRIQEQYKYQKKVRIGAAGGIATPQAALAAYIMGASYVVTGSVNQASVEAGTSDHVKKLLQDAEMADIMMAPSADMFEMGGKVQVLKKGTMYPMSSQKFYSLYKEYESIDEIPTKEKERLETRLFKKPIDEVWEETVAFFQQRDPKEIDEALQKPKKRMAMIFRWYLGQSSRWAVQGLPDRLMDLQIWCGQGMGAFNNWVKDSYLELLENRSAVNIAHHIMEGAAYMYRLKVLESKGLKINSSHFDYKIKQ